MKFNKKQFNDEQIKVIDNISRLESTYVDLMNIVSNEEINITRKRTLMFQHLILFMQQRKQDFLNVNIKNNMADKLVKNEIKILALTIKELKNVISQFD